MAPLLEREIAQTKPLTLVDQAAANLHRTSTILLQEVAGLLGRKSVSPRQYNILRILRGAGQQGLCCGEVAARLVTPGSGPDTTRLLDRLAARKWIQRAHDSKDRRTVLVRITASGLRLLESLEGPVRMLQNEQFECLNERKLKTLIAVLENLRRRRSGDAVKSDHE
jgi:DNA-binding MarR family transcriptional regulator